MAYTAVTWGTSATGNTETRSLWVADQPSLAVVVIFALRKTNVRGTWETHKALATDIGGVLVALGTANAGLAYKTHTTVDIAFRKANTGLANIT